MKISSFIPITNPKKRGDTYIEAIKSHLLFSSELIIVDGGSTDGSLEEITALNDPRIKIVTLPWPQENWSWTEFAKHWNAGLEACSGDWVAAGETDHIFHEDQIDRLKEEISLSEKLGRATVTINKMQSGAWNKWYSKAKMYYFINKKMYPSVKYGFDPRFKTDLCQPINATGIYEFKNPDGSVDELPTGVALVEQDARVNAMIGSSGVTMWNYLWTFKTFDQVVAERMASSHAWNQFVGFTDVHKVKWPEGKEEVTNWIRNQLQSVRDKAIQDFPLEKHPKIMRERLEQGIDKSFVGSPEFLIP